MPTGPPLSLPREIVGRLFCCFMAGRLQRAYPPLFLNSPHNHRLNHLRFICRIIAVPQVMERRKRKVDRHAPTSNEPASSTRVRNGYDIVNLAAVVDGLYIRCSQTDKLKCECYGCRNHGKVPGFSADIRERRNR